MSVVCQFFSVHEVSVHEVQSTKCWEPLNRVLNLFIICTYSAMTAVQRFGQLMYDAGGYMVSVGRI